MELTSTAACLACGFNSSDDVYDLQYARPGTVLGGRYLLGRYACKNGEGALYSGWDNVTQQKVWIREYFPQTMAQRDLETGSISPLSGCGAQYKAFMSDFVDICNEIKRLSVTEQVVPLENVISENNTVYAIYKGLELISLEDYLEDNGGTLSFQHAFTLLRPICNVLEVLHSHGQIHRGISPHTIYMGPGGKLYLWDFALGATRTAGSELNSELFSGYSAPEQYSPNGWQGSWTDVYAIGALFYRSLTGVVPPKSIRIDKEQNQLASIEELLPGLGGNISETVRQAMFPIAEDRLQTVQTFVSRLVEQRPASTSVYELNSLYRENGSPRQNPVPRQRQTGNHSNHQERTRNPRPERGSGSTFKYMVLGTMVMLVVLVGIIYYFVTNLLPNIIGPSANEVNANDTYENGDYDPQAPQTEALPQFIGRMFTDVENDPGYLERFIFSTRFDLRPEPGGTIFDQSPPAGSVILTDEPIRVVLFISMEDVSMPDVVGRSLEQATDILANLDIANFTVIEQISTEEAGTVLRTHPEAGTDVSPGRDTVIVIVSMEIEEPQGGNQGNQTVEDWWNIRPEDAFDPETGQYRIPVFR